MGFISCYLTGVHIFSRGPMATMSSSLEIRSCNAESLSSQFNSNSARLLSNSKLYCTLCCHVCDGRVPTSARSTFGCCAESRCMADCSYLLPSTSYLNSKAGTDNTIPQYRDELSFMCCRLPCIFLLEKIFRGWQCGGVRLWKLMFLTECGRKQTAKQWL